MIQTRTQTELAASVPSTVNEAASAEPSMRRAPPAMDSGTSTRCQRNRSPSR